MTRAQAESVDTESPLAVVKTGLCETDETFALAIHGGAVFSRSDQGRKVAFVQQALNEARTVLASGANAIDVVEAVIASMEDAGVFNAGDHCAIIDSVLAYASAATMSRNAIQIRSSRSSPRPLASSSAAWMGASKTTRTGLARGMRRVLGMA